MGVSLSLETQLSIACCKEAILGDLAKPEPSWYPDCSVNLQVGVIGNLQWFCSKSEREPGRRTIMLSRRGLFALLMISLLGSPLFGVGTTGTIVGTVTDAKGGVIAQAKVTIKNVGTNATREVSTNANGEYNSESPV